MELVGIESSKVFYLLNLFRPMGQLYDPEVVAKLAQRYSFAKFPSLENLFKNERLFGMGKFKNIQIAEFNIYSDGFIASSASDTDIIDEFIEDVLVWAKEEFGLVQVVGFPPERAYESALVVKSNVDLARALAPRNDLAIILNRVFQPDRYVGGEMHLSGFVASVDQTQFQGRRKPVSFVVDRRLGLPFDQNIFYSTAPLRTSDHLEILRSLERWAMAAP